MQAKYLYQYVYVSQLFAVFVVHHANARTTGIREAKAMPIFCNVHILHRHAKP
jgi:hypothetical protein